MKAQIITIPKKEKEADNVNALHETKQPPPPRRMTIAEVVGTVIDDGSY